MSFSHPSPPSSNCCDNDSDNESDDSNNDNAGSGVRGNSGCGGRCNKSGGDIDYAGGCNNVTMVVVVVTMVISNFSQWEFTKA